MSKTSETQISSRMTATGPHNTEALHHFAINILQAPLPIDKVKLTAQAAQLWHRGGLFAGSKPACSGPPDRPARPMRPELLPPAHVPRRKISSDSRGRIALLHALAHIELNAVDLAWDMIARFGNHPHIDQHPVFIEDWISVAWDEALHFSILSHRLAQLGASYGDLPAHDGLWEAAQKTADDLLARLAVVPMVLEARGLDVTPNMIQKLTQAGDLESAHILTRIHDDEIGHVAIGKSWFEKICAQREQSAQPSWQAIVKSRFGGDLKPPFNVPSRDRAHFPYDWYAPLASNLDKNILK